MNRRGFLQSILALSAAPAIVRADALMRVIQWDTEILTVGGTGIYSVSLIAKETLPLLENNLVLANSIRKNYGQEFNDKTMVFRRFRSYDTIKF